MHWYELELSILLKEELFQCPDCQKFYQRVWSFYSRISYFQQQQELKWASIQSFRTLCRKVTEVLHNQLSDKDFKNKSVENNNHIFDIEIIDAIE